MDADYMVIGGSEQHIAPSKSSNIQTLAVDVLSLITEFLDFYDLANIILCGNRMLNQTLCHRGGIKRLFLDRYFFFDFPRLCYWVKSVEVVDLFAPLDLFIYSGAMDSEGVKIPEIWPSLRKLSLRAKRPFVPTRYRIDLQISCPNLRHFNYIADEWTPSDVKWPSNLESLHVNQISLFGALALDLPSTLTQLHLQGIYRSPITFKELPLNLVNLDLPSARTSLLWDPVIAQSLLSPSDRLLTGLSRIELDYTAIKPEDFFPLVSLSSLTSIALHSFDSPPERMIEWSTSLKSLYVRGVVRLTDIFFRSLPSLLISLEIRCPLSIGNGDCFEALPPSLTELVVRDGLSHTNSNFLAFLPHAYRLPLIKLDWTDLAIFLSDEVISRLPHTLQTIDGTVPKLTPFRWAFPGQFHLSFGPTCTLPSSLTALYLPNYSSEFKPQMAEKMPSNLRILHIRSPNLLRPQAIAALPRTITELYIVDEAVFHSDHIPVLPSHLKNLRATFGKSTRPESLQLLPPTLTMAYFPDLLKFGLSVLEHLPNSIRRLRIPGSLYNIPVLQVLAKLPKQLIQLEMTLGPITESVCAALPRNLTHIRSAGKIPLIDGKALSSALPRLTALELPNHKSPNVRLGRHLQHLRHVDYKNNHVVFPDSMPI